uniref:Uncharacterized protein n=1 Tax=Myoviridae sp. ctgXL3 TaxID=2826681 RepID=A0A8S5QRL4_9CAUD|nr:MAG TPA: hypothetical protein [Myoviridae sp. ctgXL3]
MTCYHHCKRFITHRGFFHSLPECETPFYNGYVLGASVVSDDLQGLVFSFPSMNGFDSRYLH